MTCGICERPIVGEMRIGSGGIYCAACALDAQKAAAFVGPIAVPTEVERDAVREWLRTLKETK